MNHTTRCHPRTLRDAFKEYTESALGIEHMPVIHTQAPLLVRFCRWLFR